MAKKRQAARDGLKAAVGSYTGARPRRAPSPQDQDRTESRGVAMKRSEWSRLDAIAAENEVTKNALARYILVRFIADYETGQATLEFEPPPPQLKMP